MIEKDWNIFDFAEAEYKEWEDGNKNKCFGMRHIKTKKSHGIVRKVKGNDWIIESTFKNGKPHGLQRWINADMLQITLYHEEKEVAMIMASHGFEQIVNEGDEGALLAELAQPNAKKQMATAD